jgi:phenylpropionate dioxygenase-like ring-hydroxylating dioxygenase large terminal subunit
MDRITLPPYPNGWFALAYSDELGPGQVKPVHYLGRDLVVFRGEDGKARVFDAFCPHLGAHLGYGGKVIGSTIRCPFHGWLFDCDSGKCAEVPYAKRIPPKAEIHTWPTREMNGFVVAYIHTERKAPEYEPERVPEIDDPNYYLFRKKEWVIDSHPQEIMENGVDFAHFVTLHGWKCKKLDWRPNGPYYSLKIDVDTGAEDQAKTADNLTNADSYNSGPGFLFTRFTGAMDGIAVNGMTPVGPEKVHIVHTYWAHKKVDPVVVKAFFDFYVNDYELDIPIWSNKIYRPAPMLTEGESDFGRFRRWYRQFYSNPSPEPAISAD